MAGPLARILVFCFVLGLGGTVAGGYQCIKGYTYFVAAQHEATATGRVLGILQGKSPAYKYEFSVNGINMDDSSEVCATPLTPKACENHGLVLVYYSFQPYRNSRLEDFAIASAHAYRIGKPVLAIGFPLLVLTCLGLAILQRKYKGEQDADPKARRGRSGSDDVPDSIHVVPGE